MKMLKRFFWQIRRIVKRKKYEINHDGYKTIVRADNGFHAYHAFAHKRYSHGLGFLFIDSIIECKTGKEYSYHRTNEVREVEKK